MIKGGQIGSIESSPTDGSNKISTKVKPMSSNDVAAIIKRGGSKKLRFLLERGMTINDGIILDLFKCEEIVRDTVIASILVEFIQDINAETGTFLRRACRAGNVCIARILLKRGALYGDDLALCAAASNGRFDVVKLLLGWKMDDARLSQASLKLLLLPHLVAAAQTLCAV